MIEIVNRHAMLLAVALALTLVAGAGAATAKPDAHDRALAAQLNAKAATFSAIVSQTGENSLIKSELKDCAPFQSKDPGKVFAAAFALIPALFVRLVDDYKRQLTDIVQTMTAMQPDSPLFRQWLAGQVKSYSLILQFDNHGRTIDLCAAVTVLLDKKSTAADFQRVLGVPPQLVAKAYSSGGDTSLDPKMRTFFVAAGLSAKNAQTLTS